MLEKSSIISVRVHDKIKQKLVIESELESLTLNTLVSRTLAKHVEWDKFADDMGFVSVTKQFLKSVLDSVPEKTIETIALTTCRNAFKDIVI